MPMLFLYRMINYTPTSFDVRIYYGLSHDSFSKSILLVLKVKQQGARICQRFPPSLSCHLRQLSSSANGEWLPFTLW